MYIAMEQTFTEHTWWSPEDYHANNFEILTSDEVYSHFGKNLDYYNELERNNNHIESSLLVESHEFTAEKLNRDYICSVIQQWNNKLADLESNISEADIEPLINGLKFDERRQLIIEKPKGFFEFITYSYRDQIYQYIRYTYVPKLKACAE